MTTFGRSREKNWYRRFFNFVFRTSFHQTSRMQSRQRCTKFFFGNFILKNFFWLRVWIILALWQNFSDGFVKAASYVAKKLFCWIFLFWIEKSFSEHFGPFIGLLEEVFSHHLWTLSGKFFRAFVKLHATFPQDKFLENFFSGTNLVSYRLGHWVEKFLAVWQQFLGKVVTIAIHLSRGTPLGNLYFLKETFLWFHLDLYWD